MGGFYLGVELHRGGSASAACTAGLFVKLSADGRLMVVRLPGDYMGSTHQLIQYPLMMICVQRSNAKNFRYYLSFAFAQFMSSQDHGTIWPNLTIIPII